jgi:phenylpropionate dioxygenase-like ring-hydroxylating dioxygenase large terminal subunit
VCRHRGAEVVSGSGRCTTLQCHYHAWTYGLDGALRAAPRAGDELDWSCLGLLPAAVDTWGPFVFVNADPEAAPLAQTLGPLPDIAREHGLDLGALAFHHRVHYGVDANWKIAVMPGPPNLSIGPLWPVSPARTEGFLDYFFAPDADPGWIEEFLARDDQVGAEDVVLVESVQRGIASGALAAGELLLPAESLIAAFQRWVSDALAREPQLPGA